MRSPWIDAARGLAILMMFFNHITVYFSQIWNLRLHTFDMFGFVSMAEIFFFLSGVSCAKAYYLSKLNHSPSQQKKKILSRVSKIYFAHLICILLILSLQFFRDGDLEITLKRLFFSVFLAYQPDLANILPLYVICFLLLPLMIRGFNSNKKGWVMGVSFLLWAGAQFLPWGDSGDSRAVYTVPYFNPFAWQLPYVFGFALEVYRQSSDEANFFKRHRQVIFGVCAVSFIALFFCRHISSLMEMMNIYNARISLSWLRVLNLAAISGVALFIYPALKKFRPNFILQTMGRRPLELFVWTVIAHYFIRYFLMPDLYNWSQINQIILLGGFLLTLPLIAGSLEFIRNRKDKLAS